jgi:hypothetical protein
MTFEEDEEMEEVEVQCDVPFHQLERGEFTTVETTYKDCMSRNKDEAMITTVETT